MASRLTETLKVYEAVNELLHSHVLSAQTIRQLRILRRMLREEISILKLEQFNEQDTRLPQD